MSAGIAVFSERGLHDFVSGAAATTRAFDAIVLHAAPASSEVSAGRARGFAQCIIGFDQISICDRTLDNLVALHWGPLPLDLRCSSRHPRYLAAERLRDVACAPCNRKIVVIE